MPGYVAPPTPADYGASDPNAYVAGAQGVNTLLQGFAQRQAGQQLAQGDPAQAANTLLSSGQISAGEGLQQKQAAQQQTQQAESMKFISDTADSLEQVRQSMGDDHVLAAFDQMTPIFMQREGATPQTIAQIRQQLETNPEQFISMMGTRAKQELMKLSPGDVALDPSTGQPVYNAPFAPVVKDVPPGGTLVAYDPNHPQGQPGAGVAAPQPDQSAAQETPRLNGTAFWNNFVLPHEGGLNPHDANGSPTNFGVNQAAHPGLDVSKLTKDQAGQIFTSQYFPGAQNLPPDLAAAYADTAFITGPKRAQTMLQQSDGDPNKFMQIREAWMASDERKNPNVARYTAAWTQRNADLRQYMARVAQGGSPDVDTALPAGAAPPPFPGGATASAPGATVIATGAPTTPKPQPGFTLPAGATRYDANGKPIVTAPATGAGKLPTQDAARLKAMDGMLDNAETIADMSHQWIQGSAGVNTGPQWNSFMGHQSGTAGVSGGFRPGAIYDYMFNPQEYAKIQALDAISNRATPMLRPTGSGRILGPEYTNFAKAFPNSKNVPEANQQIDAEYQQQLGEIRQKVTFFHNWAQQHNSLDGADDAWIQQRHSVMAAAGNPATSAPSGQAPTRHRTWTPEGGIQ